MGAASGRGAVLATVLLGIGASGPAADDRAREADVFEATLRQQVDEHLDATARQQGAVICFGINPGGAVQSPSREFMARFKGEAAARRLAECEARPAGAVELMTRRPAFIVTAGPVDWVAGDEAWVTVTSFRSRSRSWLRRYRVVLERDGWVSLGPIVLDAPN